LGGLLYTLLFHPGYDGASIRAKHERWDEQYARRFEKQIRPHDNDRSPGRRLKIGYVSPDFCLHPVGKFLRPLLANHDHEVVEVCCYSGVRAPDAMTARLRASADVWRAVGGLPDEQLAELIRADRIDILVDLTMHLAGNR